MKFCTKELATVGSVARSGKHGGNVVVTQLSKCGKEEDDRGDDGWQVEHADEKTRAWRVVLLKQRTEVRERTAVMNRGGEP